MCKFYPKNYDLFKTIRRNDMLAEKILRCLEKNINSNNIEAILDLKKHDMLKTIININGIKIEYSLDTGANTTIVSLDLVKQLNLPINKQNTSNVIVANNHAIVSPGTYNLPVQIYDHIFSMSSHCSS